MSRSNGSSDKGRQREEWRQELNQGIQDFLAHKESLNPTSKQQASSIPSTRRSHRSISETRELLENKEILPPQLPFFIPLRDGRIICCPQCGASRPLDAYEFFEKDRDLICCPDCGVVGYTFVDTNNPMEP